ncbi:hypothetical protein JOF53_008188 [Crossiella equi]|uniref:FG-GAP repeat n=1 Tax=Crossiella equi TaxID=130796 RepID=A0ABS5ASB8_9PSEU|nr:VCBS repeat-containing protein [Crossiella equi]MBP2479316.1 hypothetical protein [Crossiella equi]
MRSNRLPLAFAVAAAVLPLGLLAPAAPEAVAASAATPGAPRLSSTDFPGTEEEVIAQRTIGTITARPAAGDTGVTAYRFSFDGIQERTVLAGPDGTAAIPVTVYDHFTFFRVSAVNAEGRRGPSTSWDLVARANTTPPAHRRGDANGDGLGDVLVIQDLGRGRGAMTNIYGRAEGFHTAVEVRDDNGYVQNPPVDRWVRTDLDGDGRTDLALVRQNSDGRVALYPTPSNEHNGYASFPATWTSPEPWAIAEMRFTAGDFDGDGKGDVAMLRDGQVLVSSAGAAPVVWLSGIAAGSQIVGGDFDGDGRADLAVASGGARTALTSYPSTGSAFATGHRHWELAGLATANYAAGDFDGDGRADLLALVDSGNGDSSVLGFRAVRGFEPEQHWRGAVPASAVLDLGDHNADGRADLALVANDAQGAVQVWSFVSNGTAESLRTRFAPRMESWPVVRHFG